MARHRVRGLRGGRPFHDRIDAGRELGDRLAAYREKDALVLGIPRGGVVVAAEVARLLDAELDVLVARKLGAPGMPELAIGAVTSNGGRYVNEDLVGALDVSRAYLQTVTAEEIERARRREEMLRGPRPPPRIEGRVVLLVDDGLATGSTMFAAARSVRGRRPGRLIIAVPVGSAEACQELGREADAIVCPYVPQDFVAVSLYYRSFEPVEDEAIRALLQEARRAREGRGASVP